MQGFPPNPYAPQAPAAAAYPPPAGYGAPPAPAVNQAYVTQYGPPGAPSPYDVVPPQLGGPPAPAGGYAAPNLPNLNDPKYTNYTKLPPWIPRLPNRYVLRILDFRAGQGSKYIVDLACVHVANPTAVGVGRDGVPIESCKAGEEYVYQFDLAKVCRAKDGSRSWTDDKPAKELAMLFNAIRKGQPGDNTKLLHDLVAAQREQITAFGYHVQCDIEPDGKGYTRTYFLAV